MNLNNRINTTFTTLGQPSFRCNGIVWWSWLNWVQGEVQHGNCIGQLCSFIPKSFWHIFFFTHHNLPYHGANTLIKLATDRFVWLHMTLDIQLWKKKKQPLSNSKKITLEDILAHPLVPFHQLVWLNHVYNIIGSLSPYERYTYFMVCIDCSSYWCKASPLQQIFPRTL